MSLSQAEAVCARLIGGRDLDNIQPLQPEDSKRLLELLLQNWQLLPQMRCPPTDKSLCAALTQRDYNAITNAALAIDAFSRTQYAVVAPLLNALEENGIEYSLLKGAAAAHLLYDKPSNRTGWDVDIAVRPGDLRRAEGLAIRFGFFRAQQDSKTKRFHPANPRLRALVESQHHELGFLVRRQFVTNLDPRTRQAIQESTWSHRYWQTANGGSEPWCYSAVDIHHGIALDIDLKDLLDRARLIQTNSGVVRVPTMDWVATILVYKLYWEGVHKYRKGLYQYADFCRLVRQFDDEDFYLFLDHLDRLNLIAAAHYVVRRLPAFGTPLTGREVALVELSSSPPDVPPSELNDLGDMWPKLWGRRLLC